MCGHGHGILTLVALVNIHVQADRKRLAWPYMKVGELWLEAVLSNNLPRAGKGGRCRSSSRSGRAKSTETTHRVPLKVLTLRLLGLHSSPSQFI